MLTQDGCRQRQQRLRQVLVEQNLDAAVISDPHELYYFAGVLLPVSPFSLPGLLWIDARSAWLIAPVGYEAVGVADVTTYAYNVGSTTNADWLRVIEPLAAAKLGGSVRRLGSQAELLALLLGKTIDAKLHPEEWVSIDDLIGQMERRKDADELDLIRRSIQCDLAAYRALQPVIQPGVRELDVLAAATQGAIWAAGEQIYHSGDYRAGAQAGPARDREIVEGEQYIVDAWTRYRGYWSDLSRSFAVGGVASALQQSVYDHIKGVQEAVPTFLKPGRDGTEVWQKVDALIREHPALKATGLVHHAGHGLGLRAHEMPDLNPTRGGLIEVGAVVTVEPGAYLEAEGVFVRLENMYLITPDGAESLSAFPMSLL